MNSYDILKYGHQFIVRSINGLSADHWMQSGVCGVWSVKDIIAHLASYEWLLLDALQTFEQSGETPHLARLFAQGDSFNDHEVAAREHLGMNEIWEEYAGTHAITLERIHLISLEDQRRKGSLTWYGEEYDLEDFIVYSFYGHKREHGAQIDLYRSRMGIRPA